MRVTRSGRTGAAEPSVAAASARQRPRSRRRIVVEFWLALAGAAIVLGRLIRRAWTSYRWDGRPRRRP